MIGNYGVEAGRRRVRRLQARALVCRAARDAAPPGRQGLLDWLAARACAAIEEIDTRALVRHLRDRGAMRARGHRRHAGGRLAARIAAAPRWPADLAGAVLAAASRRGRDRHRALPRGWLIDYGAKDSILRLLAEAGAQSTVLPHDAAPTTCRPRPRRHPSRQRPGRSRRRDDARRAHRAMLVLGRPAVRHLPRPPAAGPGAGRWRRSSSASATAGRTTRCWTATGRVLVTSQNHGFAVALAGRARRAGRGHPHVKLNDGTRRGPAAPRPARLVDAVPPRGGARPARRPRRPGRLRRPRGGAGSA